MKLTFALLRFCVQPQISPVVLISQKWFSTQNSPWDILSLVQNLKVTIYDGFIKDISDPRSFEFVRGH